MSGVWDIGALTSGATIELRIEVTLDDPDAELSNTATISSSLLDPDEENNSSTATINEPAGPNLDTCTGGLHPAFAVICKLTQNEELDGDALEVLLAKAQMFANKIAPGWVKNWGDSETSKLPAFCESHPDHDRCEGVEAEELDLEGLEIDGEKDGDKAGVDYDAYCDRNADSLLCGSDEGAELFASLEISGKSDRSVDRAFAAFCEENPEHDLCLEVEVAGLDGDDDEGKGKGRGKNKGHGGDDDEGDD